MINYLKFGFPLSMKGNGLYNLEVVNHSSAEAYPEAVQRYLDKEVELGAMLGPYNEIYLFIYLWFYVAFNTVQVISRRVLEGQRKPVHIVR